MRKRYESISRKFRFLETDEKCCKIEVFEESKISMNRYYRVNVRFFDISIDRNSRILKSSIVRNIDSSKLSINTFRIKHKKTLLEPKFSGRMCFNRLGDFTCIDTPCPVSFKRNEKNGFCVKQCPPGSDCKNRPISAIEYKTIGKFDDS